MCVITPVRWGICTTVFTMYDVLPATCDVLPVSNVVLQVHLDLIAQALDPVHVAQSPSVGVKEYNGLRRDNVHYDTNLVVQSLYPL